MTEGPVRSLRERGLWHCVVIFVICSVWCPSVFAAKQDEDLLAATIGIALGGPLLLFFVAFCLISGHLKRREPAAWHVYYGWVVLGLSCLISVVFVVMEWWFFAGTDGAYDAVLFGFPVVLGALWSAWLAWSVKARAMREV